MSTDTEPYRPSFRMRDKLSRMKDRFKEKMKDKAIKHNITVFLHENFTSTDTNEHTSRHGFRHGFREGMHQIKDVLKNKTHYESIKHKIKDKIDDKLDLHDNKTYPKGFYDALFSPETENDVYLQTALICLWVIALLCIIPTIIIIFLPSKNKSKRAASTNMIFFHIFLCEVCYLTYVLLAMINVAKNFRLGSFLCDVANYGMYVTIPIMQFALLFLSLERMQRHFNLTMTWAKIFTKPYLIQVILSVTWLILLALLATFMFIKKQFSFNFFKDQASILAPPIVGDIVGKLASRRHHCSVDGRLSSVFKTLIIILFIILIVKPIIISLTFNILTPCCCKNKRVDPQRKGERRTTTLVTIFLLLNLFFSFPFYFVSMFNSILTRIDSTKDLFTLVLKICFILRITNIIFECLAFYIFERNSWSLISKLFYYGTCKKFPIFKKAAYDDTMYTNNPAVLHLLEEARKSDDDDEEKVVSRPTKKNVGKRKPLKEIEPKTETEPDNDDDDDDDDDDDGTFKKKKTKKESKPKRAKTPEASDDDEKPNIKSKPNGNRKVIVSDDDDDDDGYEPKKLVTHKRKSQTKQRQSRDDDETIYASTTKRTSRSRKIASDEDDDHIQEPRNIKSVQRKSRTKLDEEQIIEQPKSHRNDARTSIQNVRTGTHRPSSSKTIQSPTKTHTNSTHKPIKHRSRKTSPEDNSDDQTSDMSQTSAKVRKISSSPKRTKKFLTESHSSSRERKHTHSPDISHVRHREEPSPSSKPHIKSKKVSSSHHHTTKKHSHHTTSKTNKPKTHTKHSNKDRYSEIIEHSHEV